MSAWLVVDTKIIDPAAYEDHKARAKPLVERHGGEYVARGGRLDVVEAELWHPVRLVIIRFPDMESAHAFIDDPDYDQVRRVRHAVARSTMAIVEGVEAV